MLFRSATVLVTGYGFVDSGELLCAFGGSESKARWLGPTMVECEAPAHEAGVVSVEVSVNGADFTADDASFEYVASATVLSATPASGPARGGTAVVVQGESFVFSQALTCRFGTLDVAASYLSSSELLCVAPEQQLTGGVSLAVSTNGLDFAAGTPF